MAIGIICEYNPFHKGHQYQIHQARCLASALGFPDEKIICVMSGNFVQRGEPAIVEKSVRTRMALLSGADMVLELPTYFSSAGAETFALGGLSLLAAIPSVRFISFGMEDPNDLPLLKEASQILSPETPAYQQALKTHLSQGLPFAKARLLALQELLGRSLPTGRNSILALEYLKAARKLSWKGTFLPVRRSKAQDSASCLRGLMLRGARESQSADELDDALAPCIPAPARQVLLSYPAQDYLSLETCFRPLQYRIACMDLAGIAACREVSDGLENRILRASEKASSYEELLENLKTSHYPTVRLRRILLNLLLGIRESRAQELSVQNGAPYLRVLGVRKESLPLLSETARSARLPLITNVSEAPSSGMLADELTFTRIYRSMLPDPSVMPPSEKSMPFLVVDAV